MMTAATLVLVPAFGIGAPARADDIPVIEAPEDVAALVGAHPRLMLGDADVARILAEIGTDPFAERLHEELIDAADGLLTEPVSTYEFPDGRTLLLVAREVLHRSYVLSMAYRLTGDEVYAQRAYDELTAVAAFSDWNPVSFLSTAELLHAYAVSYDWLYTWMDAEQRTVVRTAIVELGLAPAQDHYDAETSWTRAKHNWNVVCNSAIVIASLAIADEEPELANSMIAQALDRLPVAIAEYGPDGGYTEGIVYWGYATRYLVPLMASLESAVGDDFGISELPGLDRTLDFPLYMTGPTGLSFNYYDAAASSPEGGSVGAWLAARYDDPVYAWLAEELAQTNNLTYPPFYLLWQGLQDSTSPADAGAPLDRRFERLQTYLARSGWDSMANFFGFKAGQNGVNHSHLDLGSFVIDSMGMRWASELGPDSYGLPGYSSAGPDGPRWTYYRTRTEGQNTLVLNPGSGGGQALDATGTIVATGSSPGGSFVVSDLTQAYADLGVTNWDRGIALIDDRSRFLIQDEVTATEPVEPWWFMHTAAAVDVAPDGLSATLTIDGRQMSARLLEGPPGAQLSVMDAVPLPTSPAPAGQNANAGTRKLVVTGEESADFRISVLLEPLPTGADPEPAPTPTPLADWTVPPAPPASLASVTVDGEPLDGFSADSHSYVIERPAASGVPVIEAVGAAGADVHVEQAAQVPGTAVICVGAGPSCSARYTIDLLDPFRAPVVASVVGVNPAERAIDDDLATFWSAQGRGQWIQLNLPEARTVDGVSLAWSQGAAREYSFTIETSVDGVTWTEALTSSSSGTTAEPESHPFAPVTARYVRLIGYGSNVNEWNSLADFRLVADGQTWPGAAVGAAELTGLVADIPSELTLRSATRPSIVATYSDGSTTELGADEVELVSSAPDVAEVVDGVIVALAPGEAVIHGRYRDAAGRLAFLRADVRVFDPTQQAIVSARDGFIRDGEYAGGRYGRLPSMTVKNDPHTVGGTRQGLAVFDLSTIEAGSVVSAELTLTAGVSAGRTMQIDVMTAGTDWTESTLSWNTRPPVGTEPVGSFVAPETQQAITVDVTTAVAAAVGEELGLAFLQSPTDPQLAGATIASREAGATAPVLTVRLAVENACTRTLTGPVIDAVTVGDGEILCLDDAQVRGAVTVAAGGGLRAQESTVRGPLDATGAVLIDLVDTEVQGPLTLTGGTGTVWLQDSTVTGPVELFDAVGEVVLVGMTVNGTLSCRSATPLVLVPGEVRNNTC